MSETIEIMGNCHRVAEAMPNPMDCNGILVDAVIVSDGCRTKMAAREIGSESWEWWHEIYARGGSA